MLRDVDVDVSASITSTTESARADAATTCSTWKDKYSVSMIMMYACSYFEYIRKERSLGFFSHKGFPRVKHGVYYVCLFMWCDMMWCIYFPLHLLLYVYRLLLHCSYMLMWLILSCVYCAWILCDMMCLYFMCDK